jgi:hypothetical protein
MASRQGRREIRMKRSKRISDAYEVVIGTVVDDI